MTCYLFHALTFCAAVGLCMVLVSKGQRTRLAKGFGMLLAALFVLTLLFVILPFSEIDLDNKRFFQAWAIAFVNTTLEFLARSSLAVFFTVTALGLMLDVGWVKIGKRKRNKCGECPYKHRADFRAEYMTGTGAKHDENKN